MTYFFKGKEKRYLWVMLADFIFLSSVYWYFFNFTANSAAAYAALTFLYAAGFNFWMYKYKKNEHNLLDFGNHFITINVISVFILLSIKSLYAGGLTFIAFSYAFIAAILASYYVYRFKKQNKEILDVIKIPLSFKILTGLSVVFLCFGFFEKTNPSWALFLPAVFILICVIAALCGKKPSFKSPVSLILAGNAFFCSFFMLALNCADKNYFTLTLILHFIIFSSAVCLFKLNDAFLPTEDVYGKTEFISLMFFNAALIFILLNDIPLFALPPGFAAYIFVFAVFFIVYVSYYNYQIIKALRKN